MNSNDTIYGRFRERAQSQPDRPAILAPGKSTTTFGELLDFVDSSRTKLHCLGVGRGSRLGLLMPERVHTAVAHLVATSTCISVPLNPNMTPDELRGMIPDVHIEAMLVGDGISDQLVECAGDSLGRVISAHPAADKAGLFELEGSSDRAAVDVSLPRQEDVAVLLQTSGTSAKPKIVPQTQLNRVSAASMFRGALRIGSKDRCLNLMPTHHTQGVNAEFLIPIMNGTSVAFVDFDPGSLERAVEDFRPTWFNLVPSMHQAVLARLGDRQDVFAGSSLRIVASSSAKVATILRRRLERLYGVPVAEQYGATECSAISYSGLPDTEFRLRSVGRPLHDGVVVTDEVGDALPPGERGEICASGPSVISGYENNPEANAESFRDGWYRTGDEGYFDDDGFLYVTGRIREIVSRGGEKFSLAEVDEAIIRLDGLVEGAAFAAPHPQLGHEIYAAVVPTPGSDVTPANLRAALASHLSWAKVPKRVFLVTELPKNSIGKVLRERLVQRFISN